MGFFFAFLADRALPSGVLGPLLRSVFFSDKDRLH